MQADGYAGFINQPNLYVLNSAGAPVSAQPGNLFSPPEKYSENGVNSYEYRTARIAALWKPATSSVRSFLIFINYRAPADSLTSRHLP